MLRAGRVSGPNEVVGILRRGVVTPPYDLLNKIKKPLRNQRFFYWALAYRRSLTLAALPTRSRR